MLVKRKKIKMTLILVMLTGLNRLWIVFSDQISVCGVQPPSRRKVKHKNYIILINTNW